MLRYGDRFREFRARVLSGAIEEVEEKLADPAFPKPPETLEFLTQMRNVFRTAMANVPAMGLATL